MSRLLPYISDQAWAMDESRLKALAEIVRRHELGERLSTDELSAVVKPRSDSGNGEAGERGYFKRGSVAVIPVGGTINKYASLVPRVSAGRGTSITALRRAFANARADAEVRSVLFLIDSPGGSVSGVETLAQDIAAARKAGFPVFAYADDLAASAAYWIGSQASEFWGNRTAAVGSIGVYCIVYDTSKLYEKAGVGVHLIKAGQHKAAGADGPPVSEDDRAVIQAEIDAYYAAFKEAIHRGRGDKLSRKQVDDLADGRIHIGPAAVKVGLLDGVSPVEAVIDRMNRKFGPRNRGGSAVVPDRRSAMDDDVNVGGNGGPDTGKPQASPALSAEQVAAIAGEAAAKAATNAIAEQRKADTARREAILATVAGFDHIPAVATLRDRALVDGSVTVADATKGVLDAAKKGVPAAGTIEVGEDGRRRELRGAEAVLLARAMPTIMGVMEKGDAVSKRIAGYIGVATPDEFIKVHREAEANGVRRMRLMDIAERCIRPGALPGKRTFRSDDDVIKASFAHTSSDFPDLLSALGNKVLLSSFAQYPVTFDQWCAIGNSRDFKDQPLLTLSDFPDLLKIPEGSPAQEATMKARKEKIAPDTYGRAFSMTRRMMIDDDLDAFAELPKAFGAAAARVPEDLAYMVLTTNPVLLADNKALFHADHNNLGTPAALSVAAVEAAYAAFRKQRGFGKNKPFLDLRPTIMVVPVALRAMALKINKAEKDWASGTKDAAPNTMQGQFKVIDNPRLDDNSTTAWYLFVDPNLHRAVQVNFLDGKREPTITEIGDGSILGMTFEIIFDCGVAAVNHEAAHKNAGA